MGIIGYIIISLLLSSLFTGMEVAFISANRLKFEIEKKQKSLNSAILSLFFSHPARFISSMQTGSIIALVIYGLKTAEFILPETGFLQNQYLLVVTKIIFSSLIFLFAAEILPRTIFRINPNMWLGLFSWFLLLSYIILYPISAFGYWFSGKVLHIFSRKNKLDVNNNEDIELNYMFQETTDLNFHSNDQGNDVRIFQNALDFSRIRLRDCSVPRTEIVAVPWEISDNELKQTFIETGYSKLPVYKDNIDNITGYIHASEMFEHLNKWKKYIKDIPTVPENMTAHKLMKLFMQQKKSIAVVVDEHGGTSGIVTLEDIMEEIFGEIEDEHDTRDFVEKVLSTNEFIFSGRIEIQHLREKYNIGIPESDNYETLAGFILFHHQHFPKVNEVIHYENISCKCIKVANNRIELVRIILGS